MRKFFYGISVFLFLCVLSLGYYRTYQMAEGGRTAAESPIGPEEQEKTQTVSSQEESGYGKYYLKDLDCLVVVYRSDKKTVFETTGIALRSLPEKLSREIQEGKYIKSEKELYSFLENYST